MSFEPVSEDDVKYLHHVARLHDDGHEFVSPDDLAARVDEDPEELVRSLVDRELLGDLVRPEGRRYQITDEGRAALDPWVASSDLGVVGDRELLRKSESVEGWQYVLADEGRFELVWVNPGDVRVVGSRWMIPGRIVADASERKPAGTYHAAIGKSTICGLAVDELHPFPERLFVSTPGTYCSKCLGVAAYYLDLRNRLASYSGSATLITPQGTEHAASADLESLRPRDPDGGELLDAVPEWWGRVQCYDAPWSDLMGETCRLQLPDGRQGEIRVDDWWEPPAKPDDRIVVWGSGPPPFGE